MALRKWHFLISWSTYKSCINISSISSFSAHLVRFYIYARKYVIALCAYKSFFAAESIRYCKAGIFSIFEFIISSLEWGKSAVADRFSTSPVRMAYWSSSTFCEAVSWVELSCIFWRKMEMDYLMVYSIICDGKS